MLYHKSHYPESHYQQHSISNGIGIAKILVFPIVYTRKRNSNNMVFNLAVARAPVPATKILKFAVPVLFKI